MKNNNDLGRGPLRRVLAILLLLTGLVLSASFDTQAQPTANPPEFMTYQGYLVDSSGGALGTNGAKNYDVIFRIWDAANAGNKLWAEQQTVTVDRGYFSVLLGEGSAPQGEPRPALSTLFTNSNASDRYIAMTVKGIGAGGGDADILPRLRLMTSPYAYLSRYAATAASVAGSAISGTVPDTRLTPNVALRSGGNEFVGTQTITGGLLGVGTANPQGTLHAFSSGAPSMVLDGSWTAGTWLSMRNQTAGGLVWQMIATGTGNGGGAGNLIFTYGPSLTSTYGSPLTLTPNNAVGINKLTPLAGLRLDVAGPMGVDNGAVGAPALGTIGGSGTRIVLWPGTASDTPFAIGIDGSTLWHGVPANSAHKWYTSKNMTMILDANGGLGVGTSGAINSLAKLQVQGGAIMPQWGPSQASGILFPIDPAGGSGDSAWIRYFSKSSEAMTLEIGCYNDGDDNIALRAAGCVFINTDGVSSAKLYVNGQTVSTAGFTTSDERLKTNINSLTNSLETIEKLQGVSFNWREKEFPDRSFPEGRQIGFIAQEAGKAVPEALFQDLDGYYSFNYSAVVPILVEAVKEQQQQIKAKDSKIEDLEKRLQKLEALVQAKLGTSGN